MCLVVNGRLDVDLLVILMVELGYGLFGVLGIEGYCQGLDVFLLFIISEVWYEGQMLILVSEDLQVGLCLQSEIVLDVSGVLSVCYGVINLCVSLWQVDCLVVMLLVVECVCEVMVFYGCWICEFQFYCLMFEYDSFVLENCCGCIFYEYFLVLIIGSCVFSEMQGEVWGVYLVWSGNYCLWVEVKIDGCCYLQVEVFYLLGEMVLVEGEILWMLYLYVSYLVNGLNGMSQQFYCYLCEWIICFLGNKLCLVYFNIWEGIYFDYDLDYIMCMVDEVVVLGVECFIIDDGWFKGCNDDWVVFGDWYFDEKKYFYGLMLVIDYVKFLGMEFGIWVELEMINLDFDLYWVYLDWVLVLLGYILLIGCYQFVLNFNIFEVFDYLLEWMSWLLGEYVVDYVKWDMNCELVQSGYQGCVVVDV